MSGCVSRNCGTQILGLFAATSLEEKCQRTLETCRADMLCFQVELSCDDM
jgi:hypothetical protein